MRAMSRRTSRIRAGRSSWLVAAWKRRLNCSRLSSPSCVSSWSSVFARRSSTLPPDVFAEALLVLVAALAIIRLQVAGVAETGDHLGLHRQLHRRAAESFRGQRA